MRVLRGGQRVAWRAFAAFWRALDRWATPPRVVGGAHGVAVVDTPGEPAGPGELATVEAALALLAELDPRRLRRLVLDVDAVSLVETVAADGAYAAGSRTVYLRPGVVRASSAAQVAVLLAHEATHARLDRLRVLAWWPALRYRMEHRCLREELAFMARFPRERYRDVDGWRARREARSRYRLPPARRGRRRAPPAPPNEALKLPGMHGGSGAALGRVSPRP